MDGVQCKKCRFLLKDKDGYNWCQNKLDDPDVDLFRDCEWFAVKTNADRLRAMTDAELSVFLETTTESERVSETEWLKWLKGAAQI